MSNSDHNIRLGYVKFDHAVNRSGLAAIKALNVFPVQYDPTDRYLCWGENRAFQALQPLAWIKQLTLLTPAQKLCLSLGKNDYQPAWIVVVPGREQDGYALLQAWCAAHRIRPLQPAIARPAPQANLVRLRATLTADWQTILLAHPQVLAVEPYHAPVLQDEVAGLIVAGQYDREGIPQHSYREWLAHHDLSGAGVTIGIVDSGVDVEHPAFRGRIRDLGQGKKSWHGTCMAGLAGGSFLAESDQNGFIYGLGIAPGADLLAQDRFAPPELVCQQTVTQVGPSGIPGTVQNNSFGKGTCDPMNYTSEEALYDRLVRNADPGSPIPKPLTICFAAGNQGHHGLTRPAAAKNVIVTGNSGNYRPADGGIESDNINEVYAGDYDTGYSASSLGNCGDRRIRPHLVAPGQWTASANYGAYPGDKRYLSPHLTWAGGSSAASAITAGACALLIQWWRRQTGVDPSPAMLRSLLVNGAVDTGCGGPIPNPRQGWGRLNLESLLHQDLKCCYLDQQVLFDQAGEQRSWLIRVGDPTRPVKLTLAWTDPPGAIGSGTATVSALVNRLALRVEAGGQVYRGNHFAEGWSVAGDAPEGWDNLQNVFLAAGTAPDRLRVSVRAIALSMNCLTGNCEGCLQDFALFIANGLPIDPLNPASAIDFAALDQIPQLSAAV